MTESKERNFQFPDVSPVDHVKCCPKYTSITGRRKEDGITLDELDSLQMELEQLLAAASQRMRLMKSEIELLSDSQEVTKKDKKSLKSKEIEHKRSKNTDERPLKKMKISEGGHHSPQISKNHLNSSTASPSGGRSKAKNSSHSRILEPDVVEETPVLSRTAEVPSKFWQMMETYCGPIPPETVAFLEKLEKPVSEEYYDIPSLGKPFSLIWAEEDLAHEEKESQRASDVSSDKSSVDKVLKKSVDSLNENDTSPFGSLTQRLISAFVQENIIAPPETSSSDEKLGNTANDAEQSSTAKSSKACSAPHTTKLEARIKAELIEQGILETPSEGDKEEDEVLSELKRCQQELRAISARNRDVVSQLLTLAKIDAKKHEVMKKIELANTEVVEQYRKVSAARQKKRNLMKKEKDLAMKALKDREALVKQLEQLG